jgi:hypothetical protein
MFSLLVLYKSVILSEHHIPFAPHGFALINALALAKVVLIVRDLHLVDRFRDAPLIYPTLLKSLVFTIVRTCFKIVEATGVGKLHGKSFHESISELEGGSRSAILTLMALLFVILVPFFALDELKEVFGEERLSGIFLRDRKELGNGGKRVEARNEQPLPGFHLRATSGAAEQRFARAFPATRSYSHLISELTTPAI